jgi:hypothetical protein
VTLVAETALAESPREYFRRHLQQHALASSDLAWYLDESVPRFAGSAEVRLAVEELVDRLGEFLGFGVGRADAETYAIWTSSLGPRLVVWVDSSTRAIAAMASALHRRTQLRATLDVARDDDLTCLYALAGTCDERLLNEAVALRRASRQLRLISIPSLLSLAGAVERGRLTHRDALGLLRPASALADGIVDLTDDHTATRR